MRKTWKQILLGALTLCVLASGCGGGNGGGGNGGGGTPDDPNADLPVRKKISTPVASSFKVDGRTVNIYEYTGLTFKDQILWTDTLVVDGDRIYFFGFDTKDETYRTKLRSVSFKDETLSDLKVLDEVCAAVNTGLLPLEDVLDCLDSLSCEVVLTGRDPAPELRDRADYLTEMRKVRHPFDRGECARTGPRSDERCVG